MKELFAFTQSTLGYNDFNNLMIQAELLVIFKFDPKNPYKRYILVFMLFIALSFPKIILYQYAILVYM